MGGFAFKGLVVATQQPAFARSAPPGRDGGPDGAPPPASVHRHDYLRSPTTRGARCARARQGGLQAPAHPADGWPRRQRADPSSLGAPSQEKGAHDPQPRPACSESLPFPTFVAQNRKLLLNSWRLPVCAVRTFFWLAQV